MSTPWGVDLIVSRTQEYLLSREDYSADIVLRHLKEFTKYEDVRVFNQFRNDVPRLTFSLYELVSSLDHESSVLWAAVEALQRICQMVPNSCDLVEAYKFIPPLAEFLHADLSHEKRLRLLHLLKTLTKDLQSSHKQVPLKCLTSKLIEWIMTEEVDIVHLSLEILVNLCQNNQWLVYSLKSSIGTRFLQALMNLRSDGLDTKVLMCKLLFILEPIAVSVDGPIDIARTIMDVTFSNLMEAFEENRLLVLSNVVGFFEELVQFPIYKEILCSYDRWEQRVNEVLTMLDVEGGVGDGGGNAVLRLVTALVRADLQPLQRTLPAIADAAVKAVFQQQRPLHCRSLPTPPYEGEVARQERDAEGEGEGGNDDEGDTTCVPTALRLLCLILLHYTTPDHSRESSNAVVDLMLQHLPDFVWLLNETEPLEATDTFTCLLDLFEKMTLFEQLIPDLLSAVENERIVSAFHAAAEALDADAGANATSPLSSSSSAPVALPREVARRRHRLRRRRRRLALLCARAVSLLSALAQTAERAGIGGRRGQRRGQEEEEGGSVPPPPPPRLAPAQARDALWLHPSGQRALATAFYEGDADAKSAVLRVAAQEGLPAESALTFSKSLAAYQQSVIEPHQTKEENSSLDLKTASALSRASGGLVNSFLEEFKQKLESKEGVPVSMAMSLYEYKLAAQSRIEQALSANVTLAQNSCSGLQHHIDVLDGVIRHQRETLLDRQRLNEGLFLEVGMLRDSFLQEKELRGLSARKYEEDVMRKEKILAQKKQENLQSQKHMKTMMESKQRLEADLSETGKQLTAKCEEAAQLAARVGDLEQELKASEKQCKSKTMKLSSLRDQVRGKEQILAARDAEVKNLKKVRGSLETEVTDLNNVKEAQMKSTSERDQVLQKLKQELSELKRMRDMITSLAGGGKVE